ncbi:MAG TPA: hypothetical protein PKV16_01740 [Caldisericia bacterium]|nr:hypothetical protein [Caldisericia bacterium]HPF48875.1 hypothetical protein [Caldisericia bacterium]HPI83261.1 hypothetical protein [Caldisericia bacterium]HPQ92488.1 hypothetical protein [Caldisericia bacterium]HRV74414.1 hypothetical protein [Caldisericia bacterium]
MKNEKATAVILLLVALAGLCLLVVIGLEVWDGLLAVKRVDKLLAGASGSLKYLLKYNPWQQWVVVAFGSFLVFTGLATLAWTYHKKL